MSILDDAIREHLELKRAHGADEAELKKLEDEAFGPPGRPEGGDSLAEAPTEFLSAPEGEGREPNIADLQEPPPPAEVAQEEKAEEQPAMEHQVPEAPEERHAIADQPTEFFDVQAEMGSEEVGVPPEVEAVAEDEDDEDEEFWGEQRLSDELDRALDAPLTEDEEPEEDEELEEDEGGEETEGEPKGEDENVYDPDTGHDDVLEDTPEFLEDAPEDDELWFEQRPPKDFDFDD